MAESYMSVVFKVVHNNSEILAFMFNRGSCRDTLFHLIDTRICMVLLRAPSHCWSAHHVLYPWQTWGLTHKATCRTGLHPPSGRSPWQATFICHIFVSQGAIPLTSRPTCFSSKVIRSTSDRFTWVPNTVSTIKIRICCSFYYYLRPWQNPLWLTIKLR